MSGREGLLFVLSPLRSDLLLKLQLVCVELMLILLAKFALLCVLFLGYLIWCRPFCVSCLMVFCRKLRYKFINKHVSQVQTEIVIEDGEGEKGIGEGVSYSSAPNCL